MERFLAERRNDYIELSDSMKLTTDINSVMDSEAVVISIGAQSLENLVKQLGELGVKDKKFILCMKGIEIGTGRRLSEIASGGLDASNKIAVWIGPGHVQEFYNGVPNCMVIDSADEETKAYLIEQFSSELIRFYYGADLIGNEVGAAAKNVIGIAAGLLDGLGLSTLKGALMSRGTREVARLIKAMGGNELSAYGLCHLGDYEATVFSQFSHNRRYGEMLVKGEKYGKLAEGCFTVKAMMYLSEKHGVELPICSAVNDVLYNDAEPRQALASLFTRSLKQEF